MNRASTIGSRSSEPSTGREEGGEEARGRRTWLREATKVVVRKRGGGGGGGYVFYIYLLKRKVRNPNRASSGCGFGGGGEEYRAYVEGVKWDLSTWNIVRVLGIGCEAELGCEDRVRPTKFGLILALVDWTTEE